MDLDQRWLLVGQVGSSHLLTSGGRWWMRMHTMRVEYKKYLEPKVQGIVLDKHGSAGTRDGNVL